MGEKVLLQTADVVVMPQRFWQAMFKTLGKFLRKKGLLEKNMGL
jgi:hypothetical protein